MISFSARSWLDVDGVVKAVEQAQVKPLDKAAALVEGAAKSSMQTGGRIRGKSGPRGGKGKIKVRRSKEGDPPFVQTGVLRSSIAWASTPEDTRVIGPTSPPAHYGVFLEFGTRRMAPRPFMRPALLAVSKKFAKLWRSLPLARTNAGRKLNRRKT